MEIQQQEKNRLSTSTGAIAYSIESHLEYLESAIAQTKQLIDKHFDEHPELKAQRDLLTTIPGIGLPECERAVGRNG